MINNEDKFHMNFWFFLFINGVLLGLVLGLGVPTLNHRLDENLASRPSNSTTTNLMSNSNSIQQNFSNDTSVTTTFSNSTTIVIPDKSPVSDYSRLYGSSSIANGVIMLLSGLYICATWRDIFQYRNGFGCHSHPLIRAVVLFVLSAFYFSVSTFQIPVEMVANWKFPI
ncbi:hypothetical protein DFJ63DRAFT_318641, partial [Scheffersomyces coipomensis]|uniref:uncharacterized protein n=1 Tax=Scheffersomyces coipomensis TaxID=1788519 RepID=UPI00315D315C